jgi:hypothetical protein
MVIAQKFDGKNITDFLENFELQTKLNGITDDQERCDWMIAHSQNTKAYSRVKACVEKKSWKEAKKALKVMFKIQDKKQILSISEQLDDFFLKGFDSDTQGILHAVEKINALIRRADREGIALGTAGCPKKFYKMLDKSWRKTVRDQFRGAQLDVDTILWPEFADQLKEMVEEELIDDINDQLTHSRNKTAAAKEIVSKGKAVESLSSSDSPRSSPPLSDQEDTPKPTRRTQLAPAQKAKRVDASAPVQKNDFDAILQGIQKLNINQAKIESVETAVERLQQQLG